MKIKLRQILLKYAPYLCIAIVAIFTLGVFFQPGYPDSHDMIYHAASVVGMTDHGVLNIFTSKILSFYDNGLGYGEGLFYPPFAHICAALIYKFVSLFGFSVFAAFKIFYFLVFFFSGIFFYRFMQLVSPHKKANLFAAFIYITSPYIIVDATVRCAMAESTIFIFLPIVLMGIYHLMHKNYKRFLLCFTVGCVGLIHSHLVLTLFTIIVLIISFLPSIKRFLSKKKVLFFVFSVFMTLLISSAFLVPMLQNKANADYLVFQPGFMTSVEHMQNWRVPLDNLFSIDKPLNNMPIYLSVFGIIATIFAIVYYRKVRTARNQSFLIAGIIMTLLCTIFATTLVSWEHFPNTILMIQFPWRLLSFTCLGMAMLAGFCIPVMEHRWGKVVYALVAASCIFSVAQINNYGANKPVYVNQNEELPVRSARIVDYLPAGANIDKDYIVSHSLTPSADKEIDFTDIESNTPNLSFNASGVSGETTITLPRYYYLGYKITVIYQNGDVVDTDYSMNGDGFIEFKIHGDASVVVDYPGTTAQRAAYWLSGVSLACFSAYFIYNGVKSRKKNER